MAVKNVAIDEEPDFGDLGEALGKVQEGPRKNLGELKENRKKLFGNGSEFLPVSRNEIAGIDNLIAEADKIIFALSNADKFLEYNSRTEPGALFTGSPGVGKTLLSRYIATEADALFVDARDFGYAGRSWADVDIRELFKSAREYYAKNKRPIILFWDEFEAVAKSRSQASPDHMALISELTSQLDGVMGKVPGVFMIGCTNYDSMIDPALKRPGRLGIHLKFSSPDRKGKATLLEHYVERLTQYEGKIDYEDLAFFFSEESTAAFIEESVHEAWRESVTRTLRDGVDARLTNQDLMTVLLNRLLGPRPSFSNLTKKSLFKTAVHETGHAIVALEVGVPLRLVTVRPSTESLGRTMFAQADPMCSSIQEMLDTMKVTAGSIIAEELVNGPDERILGAHGDTRAITQSAIYLIDNNAYLSLMNPAAMRDRFYNQDPSIAAFVVDERDKAIVDLIEEISDEVYEILAHVGQKKIQKMAQLLLKKETMIGRDFEQAYRNL